ncbi:MAG: methyltransferase domain-containing protein [Actinomycetota bacterium]|nr:methyltransferase domain-containing protein [Actinomycetota bacterium]
MSAHGSSSQSLVVWHDVECGAYQADLALWVELAKATDDPVLDIGAGTGRVALTLAATGCRVVALDREPVLLDALAQRAADAGLAVECVVADAADYDIESTTFGLIIVPMQTIQLLDSEARAAFLACAHRALRAGGLLALAVADTIEAFERDEVLLPDPDRLERDGWSYESQPLSARRIGDCVRLERLRQAVSPSGERLEELDEIDLADISPAHLRAEGERAGFVPQPSWRVPPTPEHVGSEVVMLRA